MLNGYIPGLRYNIKGSVAKVKSTLNGLLRCIFRVLSVSNFNGLYSAPRPFLLTWTTVNVDSYLNRY